MVVLVDKVVDIGIRLIWGSLQFVSAQVSGFSAAIATAEDIKHREFIEAIHTAFQGATGYVYDQTYAAGLVLGIVDPIAPEAIGIDESEWKTLSDTDTTIEALHTWAHNAWPTNTQDFGEDNLRIFLTAGRLMTIASALSYANQEEAQKVVGDDSWKIVVLEHGGYLSGSAQAMLLLAMDRSRGRPVAILAFRGSELPDNDKSRQAIPDWLRNFDFALIPYHHGDESEPKAARGWLKGWRHLQPLILKEIHALSEYYEGLLVDLYITGHSQGGALAALSLLDLLVPQGNERPFYSVRGCFTVAQPLVGDKALTEAVDAAVSNAGIPLHLIGNEDVTGFDPVISVPPGLATPAGHFWKVRVGQTTTGPEPFEKHKEIVEISVPAILRRAILSTPLHWPGTRVGYLKALES